MSAPAFPDERSQLALLQSGASLNDKATACQQLAIVGTSKSIPILTALLDHEQLSSHALIALEAIASPGVSEALIAALAKLEGLRLSGVVLALGRLRETKAIAPLRELIFNPSAGVQDEAIAALGLIASPKSGALLELVLQRKDDPLHRAAGHAALVAAELLHHEGYTTEAQSLLQATQVNIPEGPVHQAAKRLTAANN